MLNILETQKKLLACVQPSGFEDALGKLLMEMAAVYADDVRKDTLGNIICHKIGKGAKMMFAAHMDVSGLMVSYVDARGFLRVEPIGSMNPALLYATPVISENGIRGAVFPDSEAGFPDSSLNSIDMHDLFIDIGAKDRAEALSICPIGSLFRLDAEASVSDKCLVSPYIDNLAGCICLLIAMSELKIPENDLYFVFTVQKEVGNQGARSAAFAIAPDVGFSVDVTATGDSPEINKWACTEVKLNNGPAIKIEDRSLLCNQQAIQHLRIAAEKVGVRYADEMLHFDGTDASSIQRAGEGVLTGAVSIPVRCIHSPGEMASLNDIRQAGKLIVAAAELPFCM
jgi:putative aminopeptidase FrvX